MDKISFEEIVSVLAMNGRPDLIMELKEHVKVDEDYVPPKFMKREPLSDDEGSASSEGSYTIEEDEDGFLSLK
jgi:hypothetical protein